MNDEMTKLLAEAVVLLHDCDCDDCIQRGREMLKTVIPTAHQCREAGWALVLPWTAKDKGCHCFERGAIRDERVDVLRAPLAH